MPDRCEATTPFVISPAPLNAEAEGVVYKQVLFPIRQRGPHTRAAPPLFCTHHVCIHTTTPLVFFERQPPRAGRVRVRGRRARLRRAAARRTTPHNIHRRGRCLFADCCCGALGGRDLTSSRVPFSLASPSAPACQNFRGLQTHGLVRRIYRSPAELVMATSCLLPR